MLKHIKSWLPYRGTQRKMAVLNLTDLERIRISGGEPVTITVEDHAEEPFNERLDRYLDEEASFPQFMEELANLLDRRVERAHALGDQEATKDWEWAAKRIERIVTDINDGPVWGGGFQGEDR